MGARTLSKKTGPTVPEDLTTYTFDNQIGKPYYTPNGEDQEGAAALSSSSRTKGGRGAYARSESLRPSQESTAALRALSLSRNVAGTQRGPVAPQCSIRASIRGDARAGCDRGEFRLVHYALLGNHAHLIVEAKDRHALGRGMKSVTMRIVRAAERAFAWRGRILADRYHMRILKTPREVRNAIRYVLLNARRHASRSSRGGTIDPASSGRWFDGWKKGTARVDGGIGTQVVAAAHTWLLRAGWRRYGLLDPMDVPGGARASP